MMKIVQHFTLFESIYIHKMSNIKKSVNNINEETEILVTVIIFSENDTHLRI